MLGYAQNVEARIQQTSVVTVVNNVQVQQNGLAQIAKLKIQQTSAQLAERKNQNNNWTGLHG